jgi:hypothetical protein
MSEDESWDFAGLLMGVLCNASVYCGGAWILRRHIMAASIVCVRL